jgi:hypothetical protein
MKYMASLIEYEKFDYSLPGHRTMRREETPYTSSCFQNYLTSPPGFYWNQEEVGKPWSIKRELVKQSLSEASLKSGA